MKKTNSEWQMADGEWQSAISHRPSAISHRPSAISHQPSATFLSNPDLRFVLFGGKGGTGKTTSAAAAALRFARQRPNRKLLLVSTDPAHSLSDSLACPVGGEIATVAGVPNFFALALDTAALLADFKRRHGPVMQLIASRGTYFDQEDIAGFFELSLPGMDEVMAIIKIMDLTSEVSSGSPTYDLVILDTAPAGHTIRLLALPAHIEQWIRVMDLMLEKHRWMVQHFRGKYAPDEADRFLLDLGRDVKRVRDLLRDPRTTEFVPVVNPEAMSIAETETLFRALSDCGIPVRSVIVNRLAGAMGDCPFCQARQQNQAPYLREIAVRFGDYDLVTMPLFPHEVRGVEALAMFAEMLFAADRAGFERGSGGIEGQEGRGAGETRLCSPAPPLPCPSAPLPSIPATNLTDLLKRDLRFILVGGKGGVGKTTVAAATALALAWRNPEKRTLIFSTDPASSLPDCLSCAIGDRPTPVPGVAGLDAVQINADAGLAELNERYTVEINEVFDSFLAGSGMEVAFDREVMLELISLVPPGLDEIISLISLMDLLEAGKYDHVVLDTAPTGHMLRLLEMPGLAMDWFRTFFRLLLKYRGVVTLTKTAQLMVGMFKGVKKVQEHLVDPRQTEFVAVTIPEAMGILETGRFLAALAQMQIPCRRLIVNMAVPPTDCDFCRVKRDEQQAYIRGLAEQFPSPDGDLRQYAITELPLFPHEIRGLAGLREVGNILYGRAYV
jgi:arsenite-transporting ATPase